MQNNNAFLVKRINDHVQYLRKIKGRLDNQNDFQPTDCHTCVLGKWLNTEGSEELARYGAPMEALLERLKVEHEKFHVVSDTAVQCHEQGDTVGEYREMTQMHKLSNSLISILLEMDGLVVRQNRKALSA